MTDSTHGGRRAGAGRKSAHGEPTKVMRVPVSKVEAVRKLVAGDEQSATVFGAPSGDTAGRLRVIALQLAGCAANLEADKRRGHLSADVAMTLRQLEGEMLGVVGSQ